MIRIDRLKKTCEGCPTQWEGITTDGGDVHIRYRWGTLVVYIDGVEYIYLETGNELHGNMTMAELINYTQGKISFDPIIFLDSDHPI